MTDDDPKKAADTASIDAVNGAVAVAIDGKARLLRPGAAVLCSS